MQLFGLTFILYKVKYFMYIYSSVSLIFYTKLVIYLENMHQSHSLQTSQHKMDTLLEPYRYLYHLCVTCLLKRSTCGVARYHTGTIWQSLTFSTTKGLIIFTDLHCVIKNIIVSIKTSSPGDIHHTWSLGVNRYILWWVWYHCEVRYCF